MLALLSGVLQVLVFPKPGFGILSWLALTPFLLALAGSPPRMEVLAPGEHDQSQPRISEGFWLGLLCGTVFYVGCCYWFYRTMRIYGGLDAPIAFALLILFGIYLGLYHGLFGLLFVRLAARRGTNVALAASPLLWVAIELARSRITGCPWELLGYAQIDNIPLTRMATVTGVYGLSFVIAGVNAGLARAWLARNRAKWVVVSLMVAGALQTLAFYQPAILETNHRAWLVQENIPVMENQQWTDAMFDDTVADLVRLSEQEPGPISSPNLIVWPESPAPFFFNDPRLRAALAKLAGEKNAFLIVGSLGSRDVPSGEAGNNGQNFQMFNSATLIAPSGDMLGRYDKIHLVPFGEYVPFRDLLFFAKKLTREVGDFTPGASRNAFVLDEAAAKKMTANMAQMSDMAGMNMSEKDSGSQQRTAPPQQGDDGKANAEKVGIFICYESVFPDEVRQFTQNGAQVLVNISNDGWYGHTSAPLQHLQMARMRAIENHRWLLRDTNTGITASVDPYGRIVAGVPRDVRTALDAPYALEYGTTFYIRHGDWLAWGCAIIAFILLFASFRFTLHAGRIG